MNLVLAQTLHALSQTVASPVTKEVADTVVAARAATAVRVDTVVDTAVSLAATVVRPGSLKEDSEVKVIIKLNSNPFAFSFC
jgi:hypothetical protein